MLLKTASEELADKVFKYLKGDYPLETIEWVKEVPWEKTIVSLEDLKMGRRPGGAREPEKTEALKEKYENGEKLDPVIVVKDGNGDLRLADGYHRTLGRKKAGFKNIDAYVGTSEDVDGPWKSEMHDKKISKGVPHEKTANLIGGSIDVNNILKGNLNGLGDHLIEKQANPLVGMGAKMLGGAKTMGSKVTAGGKNYWGNLSGSKVKGAKADRKELKKNFNNNPKNWKDSVRNTYQTDDQNAKDNVWQARKDRFKTRAATTAVAGTALKINSDNNASKRANEEAQRQNMMYQQQQQQW